MAMDTEASPEQKALALAAARMIRRMQRAQSDFSIFAEDVCLDEHGGPIRLAPIHRSWMRHIEYCWPRKLRALLLAPFGSGKSSTLAVPLACWLVGRDVSTRIKFVTNDDPSASKRVMAAKRIIESLAFRRVFPHARKGDRWTDHELYMRRPSYASVDPSMHARGIFTTGIGGRADCVIFDDIVDQKNSVDPAQRRRVLEFAEATWLSRLEPDANVLAIGTAWHQSDAYHVWMQRRGWCTLVQRVADDCMSIEQEVYGAADGAYPVVG